MSEACVILNDIHIDIMDYIKPAYCNEAQVSYRVLLLEPKKLIEPYIVPEHVDGIRMGEQSECLNDCQVCLSQLP